jgi:hypothetical protein
MDFWVAIISGGAAVLGAAVGGVVSALPAFGAERRAAENARRDELRRAILDTLAAVTDTRRALAASDHAGTIEASGRYIRCSAELGTLLRRNETAVASYVTSVMAAVIGEHPEGPRLLSQASVILPAWYRGSATLRKLDKYRAGHPKVDELRELEDQG